MVFPASAARGGAGSRVGAEEGPADDDVRRDGVGPLLVAVGQRDAAGAVGEDLDGAADLHV
jgi:hypothetical protein